MHLIKFRSASTKAYLLRYRPIAPFYHWWLITDVTRIYRSIGFRSALATGTRVCRLNTSEFERVIDSCGYNRASSTNCEHRTKYHVVTSRSCRGRRRNSLSLRRVVLPRWILIRLSRIGTARIPSTWWYLVHIAGGIYKASPRICSPSNFPRDVARQRLLAASRRVSRDSLSMEAIAYIRPCSCEP